VNSEARERVLDAAERLFTERGYNSVKLKDIAKALEIAHASLYHHFPDGKRQMFVAVMERNLNRHRAALADAITKHDGDLRGQLRAIAAWLLSQPPLDFIRMSKSDLEALDPADAVRLAQLALEAMIEPIATALYAAAARGEVEHPDLGLIAGGMFGMIQSMHMVPSGDVVFSREAMVNTLIDAFLNGLLKR
jgi:AcrR family transcriptional regulator